MSGWRAYWCLMRFDRPIGIYLLLWPTAWAIWVAGDGHPSWEMCVVFFLGTVIMRALGCVVNDLLDRNVDGHVMRTRLRPLPAGELAVFEAVVCLCALIVLAGALAVCFLSWGTIWLACIGLLLALVYPLAKRVMGYPQGVLGLAFAWGVPMAFWQLGHALPLIAWGMLGIAWLWPFMYDTQYALVDVEDDARIGVRSSALSMGRHTLLVIRLAQVVLILGWVLLGLYLGERWIYFGCCAVVVGLFIYQDGCLRSGRRDRYFSAFLSNHWVGLFILLGLIAGWV